MYKQVASKLLAKEVVGSLETHHVQLTSFLSFGWTERSAGERGCCFNICHLLMPELSSLVGSSTPGQRRALTPFKTEETFGKLTLAMTGGKGRGGSWGSSLSLRSLQAWLLTTLQGWPPGHADWCTSLLPSLVTHQLTLPSELPLSEVTCWFIVCLLAVEHKTRVFHLKLNAQGLASGTRQQILGQWMKSSPCYLVSGNIHKTALFWEVLSPSPHLWAPSHSLTSVPLHLIPSLYHHTFCSDEKERYLAKFSNT